MHGLQEIKAMNAAATEAARAETDIGIIRTYFADRVENRPAPITARVALRAFNRLFPEGAQ